MSEPLTTSVPARVPFARMKSFPALFERYCTDRLAGSDFYAGDFQRAEDRAAAAERAAAHPRDRETLAAVLLEQNARWGMTEATRANIETLREPESVAVVTGQQVGLFGGPLYTVIKAVTAVQLARRTAEETGRPAVPVFWLEGEDHDFAEVAGTLLLQGNDAVRIQYEPSDLSASGNPGPVGRLPLSERINEAVAKLEEALQPSDFKDEVMQIVRAAYAPGTTMLDAFARLMTSLFGPSGLVLLNPGDARLKRLAAPLFQKELEGYQESAARLRKASEEIAREHHAQVTTRPTSLFLVSEDGRYALEPHGDGFRLRGTDRAVSQAEAASILEQTPERFSPNVALRPLMQDLLLPTAAYVGGPAEVSYFAQFRPLYEWAGIPMPVIYPRASATLVEPKVQKVLDRYGLTVADFEQDPERLFQQVVQAQMGTDVEQAFARASEQVGGVMDNLKSLAEGVDQTLSGSVDATRTAIGKELEKLQGRIVKAEKRRHDDVRVQLEKARVSLSPGGKLQERALSPLYLLNKYGFGLIERLEETLSLDTTSHQVVLL